MSGYALPGMFPSVAAAWEDEEVSCFGGCSSDDGWDPIAVTVKSAKVDALHLIQPSVPASRTNRRRQRTAPRQTLQPRPEELAVQFEMDIRFQGKECTVVRSLFRMRQLREELVEEDSSKRLPPLPSLPEHSKRNLTVLQASLLHYVPELEDWLRALFRLVPIGESPTLLHFVLEPLCFLHTVSADVYLDWNRTRKQILSLESIAEEQHLADE